MDGRLVSNKTKDRACMIHADALKASRLLHAWNDTLKEDGKEVSYAALENESGEAASAKSPMCLLASLSYFDSDAKFVPTSDGSMYGVFLSLLHRMMSKNGIANPEELSASEIQELLPRIAAEVRSYVDNYLSGRRLPTQEDGRIDWTRRVIVNGSLLEIYGRDDVESLVGLHVSQYLTNNDLHPALRDRDERPLMR